MKDRLAVGIVRAAHGVRGELAVASYSGDLARLARLTEAVAVKDGRERRIEILGARVRARDVLFSLRGVDSREKAQAFIGCRLLAPRGDAAPLEKGEFYEADLDGCVLYHDGERMGTVRGVVEGAGSPLLDVRGVDGKDHLIPFIDHFIGEVDVENGKISLREKDILR